MRFSELTSGRVIDVGPREITEVEIIEFARRYDPQYFHTDPDRAAASRWGGLIASGWMTGSVVMQMTVAGVLDGSTCIGSPGVENLEWLQPVRPGDILMLRITVLESRISKSGVVGIVRWTSQLLNQESIAVFNMISTVFFDVETR
jgi:acyl dehydratase